MERQPASRTARELIQLLEGNLSVGFLQEDEPIYRLQVKYDNVYFRGADESDMSLLTTAQIEGLKAAERKRRL